MTSSEIIEARENKEKGLAYCFGKPKEKHTQRTHENLYI